MYNSNQICTFYANTLIYIITRYLVKYFPENQTLKPKTLDLEKLLQVIFGVESVLLSVCLHHLQQLLERGLGSSNVRVVGGDKGEGSLCTVVKR